MFSSKINSLVRKQVKELGLDPGISYTYLFAKAKGYPTNYFPFEYDRGYEDVPVSYIFNEKVPTEWVNDWIKLWPTPSQIQRGGGDLMYSISGHAPEVRKRFKQFFGDWNKRFPEYKDWDIERKLDIIQQATINYLEHLEQNEYMYAKKNHKFIQDTNGSVLEEWIRKTLNNNIESPKRIFEL